MTLPLAIPSPSISYFELGPLRIHFYALFMIAAISVAAAVAGRRMRRNGAAKGTAIDIALWAVPIGIVGGRLYHVVTHPTDYFYAGADLWRTLYIWEGGLAIFGSILFGTFGAWIGARRAGVSFVTFADAVAPGLLLAQAIGRIGNYFNQELFGTPTTLPWGLQIDPSSPAFPVGLPAGTLFHPLFLYEMLWNLAGVAVILIVERLTARRAGFAIGSYLIWYGIGRAWFESFRLDPTEFELFGVKINIVTAFTAVVIGAIIIVVHTFRVRGMAPTPHDPAANAVAETDPAPRPSEW
jgi:prolipoprotein diacylglyceryl transferase